jgi:hypothetical protein
MSTSFGRWYEEKKNEEGGDSGASSWFDTESLMPMLNAENFQAISWSSMKQSMENQMPKQILGMSYQQRFKVRLWKFIMFVISRVLPTSLVATLLAFTGFLCVNIPFGTVFWLGFLRRNAHDSCSTAKIRTFFYLWIADIHGQLRNHERPSRTTDEHVSTGSTCFHITVLW